MKIVNIFAHRLYAVHYPDKGENELEWILNQWNDVEYLYKFVKSNQADMPRGLKASELVTELMKNAENIENRLNEICESETSRLEEFFQPLDNHEFRLKILSKQKGRKNYLRLYALKIDEDCFIITGGAIKFHHLNKDREHTKDEMRKLERCKDFLKSNGVFDDASFFELLSE